MRISLPEQVSVDLRPAGYGSRALAYIFDFCLRWIFTLTIAAVIAFLVSYFVYKTGTTLGVFDWMLGIKDRADGHGPIFKALFIAFIFLVEYSYPIYFEVWRQGVSPGKKIFGLRVVDIYGLPISFQASALRTILLIIDIMPFCGFVALISMMLSKRSQRLGDIAANTLVIYEPEIYEAPDELSQIPLDSRIAMNAEHYALLSEYIQRRPQLLSAPRETIAVDLHDALQAYFVPHSSEMSVMTDISKRLDWLYERAIPSRQEFEDDSRV